MATQIKLRRDTDANWTTNSTVVLAEGEIGVNLTSGQFKLGNGTSTWAQLSYFQPGAGDSVVNGVYNITMDTTGDFVPSTDNLQDLGSPTNRFRSVYVGPGSVYVGNSVITESATGSLVIPGLTRATGYYADEVEKKDRWGSNPTITGTVTVIDAQYYEVLAGRPASGDYAPATYTVEKDDNRVDEITVDETGGGWTKTEAEYARDNNMYATNVAGAINNFNAGDWQQIPFRVEIKAEDTVYEDIFSGGTDLPSQSGQEGKFLRTDGSALSWVAMTGGGVVVRAVDFPGGEEGDTRGTIADAGEGVLYYCTQNWGEPDTFEVETAEQYAAGQTGGDVVFVIPQSAYPELASLVDINNPGVWSVTGELDLAGEGTWPVNSITVVTASEGEFTGEDCWWFNVGDLGLNYPTETEQIPAGSTFQLNYARPIWQEVSTGDSDLGNFTFNADTITNGDGLILNTNRGSLAIGTNMEYPGMAGHFHIAFDGSNSEANANDLFLGDDYNYVKLPGYELNPATYGVEIGTKRRSSSQNIEVGTVDELVPPGGVWRLFIDHDTYPNLGSLVSVGDTVTTTWGTPITATITDVVEEPGNWWKIHVAQDITAGFSGGGIVSFGSSGNSYTWRFGTDGGLKFPDGTTQTTAYTGQTSGSGTLYIMANIDGNIVTSTNGTTWSDPVPSGLTGINRVAIHNGVIVYISSSDSPVDNPGLYYSTVIGTVELCIGTDVYEGRDVFWNQVRYFDEPNKWVAVGYIADSTNDYPVVAHSTNGISWTLVPFDTQFGAGFNTGNDNWELTDVAYMAETGEFVISSSLGDSESFAGIFITDDVTVPLTGATHVAIDLDVDHTAPWSVVGLGGPPGYMILFGTNDEVWYGYGTDPENFGEENEIWGGIIQDEIGYVPQISDIAYSTTGFIAVTQDGQVITAVGSMGGPGAIVSVPLPYTVTDFSISRANPAVLTYTAPTGDSPDSTGISNNEKIVITGSDQFNGTYYYKASDDTLYTDQELTSALDSSGFDPFVSGGTLTMSKGTYFDAAGTSPNYYYIGNDDEQIFRSTNGITWTQLADVTGGYFNDFAYGTFGSGSDSTVTVSETAPSGTTSGALWFNSTDGRLYVNYSSTWIDASPTEVNANSVMKSTGGSVILEGTGDHEVFGYPTLLDIVTDDEDPTALTIRNAQCPTYGLEFYVQDNGTAEIARGNGTGGDGEDGDAPWLSVDPDGTTTISVVDQDVEWQFNPQGEFVLPDGGIITESIVTSNPTIELTPAGPDAVSQKLVIKGGGYYPTTANGILLHTSSNTRTVGETVIFYVEAASRANETLYWWIVPDAGISLSGSGTVALDGDGLGNFSFTLDSDDFEFTVRVSPVNNVYDPATIGVESILMNSAAPTFTDGHHLHLTTGNLAETSIFLGTDDHNVRTTTSGTIEITTPAATNNVWLFDIDGDLILPTGGNIVGGGINKFSTYNGDQTIILGPEHNGQFLHFEGNEGNSTIHVPPQASVPIKVGFIVTIVMDDFGGDVIYVNNDYGSGAATINAVGHAPGTTDFWVLGLGGDLTGIYTLMKVAENRWILSGPDVQEDL